MFNLRDFIMSALEGMNGNYPDFQIREFALNWYGKGKLTEDDLAAVEDMLIQPSEEPAVVEEKTLTEEVQ